MPHASQNSALLIFTSTMNKVIRIAVIAFLALVFIFGIKYSAHIQSITGLGDLRSRIVGARHIKDGQSPYYHSWYPGDSLRYFSGLYIDTPRVKEKELANLTASPAMLRCMTVFADEDEYKIDWGFFIAFHLFFVISIALALYYTPAKKRLLCLLLLVPFIITDGWIYHFYVVQHYIPYGFLLTIIIVLLLKNKQFAAGGLFAILFLLRLNTLLFAIPFLLLAFHYRKFIITSFTGVAIYAVFVLLNPFEKKLWLDYFSSLKIHQAEQMVEYVPAIQGNFYTLPLLPRNFEGTDYIKLDSLMRKENFSINKESSNFKNAYLAVAGHYPSVMALQLLLLASIVAILLWYIFQIREKGKDYVPAYELAITGLLFYFLSNFFSTVATVPYHLPQWWAMAVIYAIYADRIPRLTIILFLAGILLNNHFAPDFRGRHLLAEMLLLASALVVVFIREKRTGPDAEQRAVSLSR
jgi:hypothetical protein